ncbi:MAG: Ycf66 family protein [Cyanobacteria bacterium J06621_8]
MVNLGGGPSLILGLVLAIAGAGLFFLRSIRPELARDYDVFFAAVGLLCGLILIFYGWRLEPILQFGQFLLTGTAIFFGFESIRLRGAATEQARRSTATVDRDRPVSRTRVYTEAELDKIDPYDEPYNNVYEGAEPNYSSPRLRGYDEPQPRNSRRSSGKTRPGSDYRDEPRRRTSRNRPERDNYASRSPQGDRYGYDERDNRPPRRRSAPSRDSYDEWDDTPRNAPRRSPASTVDKRRSSSREDRYPDTANEPRRKTRPGDLGRNYEPESDYASTPPRDYSLDNLGSSYDDSDLGRSYEDDNQSIPGDYVVDYQPLDNMGTDYRDDDYDDSEPDDYDESGDRDSEDNYDDYDQPPERRTPINLNNNKDYE